MALTLKPSFLSPKGFSKVKLDSKEPVTLLKNLTTRVRLELAGRIHLVWFWISS